MNASDFKGKRELSTFHRRLAQAMMTLVSYCWMIVMEEGFIPLLVNIKMMISESTKRSSNSGSLAEASIQSHGRP